MNLQDKFNNDFNKYYIETLKLKNSIVRKMLKRKNMIYTLTKDDYIQICDEQLCRLWKRNLFIKEGLFEKTILDYLRELCIRYVIREMRFTNPTDKVYKGSSRYSSDLTETNSIYSTDYIVNDTKFEELYTRDKFNIEENYEDVEFINELKNFNKGKGIIVYKKLYEDKKFKDIAYEMDLTLDTVKSRYKSCYKKLEKNYLENKHFF